MKKFLLERFSKFSNIENYTLRRIDEMYDLYVKYLKDNKGLDPLIPGVKLELK